MRSGRIATLFAFLAPAALASDFGSIVEFRDPPLVLQSRAARAAMVDYQATFQRFRALDGTLSIRYPL